MPVPKCLEKQIFFKLTDMVTIQKIANFFSFESNTRKQCLYYLLFYKMVETTFSNFLEGLSLISPKLYTEFVHESLHIQPSKYDSTSGTKISICLKKVGGMRLWIGTSTFNNYSLITQRHWRHV